MRESIRKPARILDTDHYELSNESEYKTHTAVQRFGN